MQNKFSNLLSTGYIGDMEIPNRVVMAPIGSLNADTSGHISARNINYYVDKAEGGTGLIVIESCYPDDIVSKGEDGEIGVANNTHNTGLALLATAIHDHYGTKCVLQINHMGKQLSFVDRCESWAPSDLTEMLGGIMPLPLTGMTREQIKQLVQDFSAAAWRAKVSGFDGVEIHCANGHLLNMFLTPFYNRRIDEYGGSDEGRIRIVLEIIKAIQLRCGRSFPIIVRLCGCDLDEDQGIMLENGVAYAKMLEEAGVAALNVTGGSLKNGLCTPTMYDSRANFVFISEAIKNAGVKIPIIIAGSITTPELAEQILAEGKADFIGIARPLLADSEWVKKLEEGRPEDIVPCIRCGMGCVGTQEEFNASIGLRCAVNPRCNLYEYRNVKPLQEKKKLAIIGGGPGGMEAARLAAIRGHEVVLYEKRKLGGAMHEANFDPALKADIQYLIDYYITQMKKLNIKIINKEATAETLVTAGYDAAIVATGASCRPSTVPGHELSHVYTDLEYTSDPSRCLGENVVVVGGGVVAAEIAVSLAMKGKKVILTTRRGLKAGMMEIAMDDSSPAQIKIITLLATNGVDVRFGLTLKEIKTHSVISKTPSGEMCEIPCDNVILCTGFIPNDQLYKDLQGKLPKVYKIGDCAKARTIGPAIHEGWVLANQI